jgi:4'-phosphopantetheinyl transferase
LQKDGQGVPLPSNGWYWTVTHKPAYVAGVAGRKPLGIDIERIRPRSRNLFKKIADQQEWQLGGEDEWHLFYRFWTAKEAVLKAVGVGMKGLSNCRVVSIGSADTLTLVYQGTSWEIQQRILDGHLVAITTNGMTVHWDSLERRR